MTLPMAILGDGPARRRSLVMPSTSRTHRTRAGGASGSTSRRRSSLTSTRRATASLSSSGDRETDLSDSSGFSSGARWRAHRHRKADDDQVAFRVLEPRDLRPTKGGDAIDGLGPGHVVLFEFDALGLEVLDGPL